MLHNSSFSKIQNDLSCQELSSTPEPINNLIQLWEDKSTTEIQKDDKTFLILLQIEQQANSDPPYFTKVNNLLTLQTSISFIKDRLEQLTQYLRLLVQTLETDERVCYDVNEFENHENIESRIQQYLRLVVKLHLLHQNEDQKNSTFQTKYSSFSCFLISKEFGLMDTILLSHRSETTFLVFMLLRTLKIWDKLSDDDEDYQYQQNNMFRMKWRSILSSYQQFLYENSALEVEINHIAFFRDQPFYQECKIWIKKQYNFLNQAFISKSNPVSEDSPKPFKDDLDLQISYQNNTKIENIKSKFGINYEPLLVAKKIFIDEKGQKIDNILFTSSCYFYILAINLSAMKNMESIGERKWLGLISQLSYERSQHKFVQYQCLPTSLPKSQYTYWMDSLQFLLLVGRGFGDVFESMVLNTTKKYIVANCIVIECQLLDRYQKNEFDDGLQNFYLQPILKIMADWHTQAIMPYIISGESLGDTQQPHVLLDNNRYLDIKEASSNLSEVLHNHSDLQVNKVEFFVLFLKKYETYYKETIVLKNKELYHQLKIIQSQFSDIFKLLIFGSLWFHNQNMDNETRSFLKLLSRFFTEESSYTHTSEEELSQFLYLVLMQFMFHPLTYNPFDFRILVNRPLIEFNNLKFKTQKDALHSFIQEDKKDIQIICPHFIDSKIKEFDQNTTIHNFYDSLFQQYQKYELLAEKQQSTEILRMMMFFGIQIIKDPQMLENELTKFQIFYMQIKYALSTTLDQKQVIVYYDSMILTLLDSQEQVIPNSVKDIMDNDQLIKNVEDLVIVVMIKCPKNTTVLSQSMIKDKSMILRTKILQKFETFDQLIKKCVHFEITQYEMLQHCSSLIAKSYLQQMSLIEAARSKSFQTCLIKIINLLFKENHINFSMEELILLYKYMFEWTHFLQSPENLLLRKHFQDLGQIGEQILPIVYGAWDVFKDKYWNHKINAEMEKQINKYNIYLHYQSSQTIVAQKSLNFVNHIVSCQQENTRSIIQSCRKQNIYIMIIFYLSKSYRHVSRYYQKSLPTEITLLDIQFFTKNQIKEIVQNYCSEIPYIANNQVEYLLNLQKWGKFLYIFDSSSRFTVNLQANHNKRGINKSSAIISLKLINNIRKVMKLDEQEKEFANQIQQSIISVFNDTIIISIKELVQDMNIFTDEQMLLTENSLSLISMKKILQYLFQLIIYQEFINYNYPSHLFEDKYYEESEYILMKDDFRFQIDLSQYFEHVIQCLQNLLTLDKKFAIYSYLDSQFYNKLVADQQILNAYPQIGSQVGFLQIFITRFSKFCFDIIKKPTETRWKCIWFLQISVRTEEKRQNFEKLFEMWADPQNHQIMNKKSKLGQISIQILVTILIKRFQERPLQYYPDALKKTLSILFKTRLRDPNRIYSNTETILKIIGTLLSIKESNQYFIDNYSPLIIDQIIYLLQSFPRKSQDDITVQQRRWIDQIDKLLQFLIPCIHLIKLNKDHLDRINLLLSTLFDFYFEFEIRINTILEECTLPDLFFQPIMCLTQLSFSYHLQKESALNNIKFIMRYTNIKHLQKLTSDQFVDIELNQITDCLSEIYDILQLKWNFQTNYSVIEVFQSVFKKKQIVKPDLELIKQKQNTFQQEDNQIQFLEEQQSAVVPPPNEEIQNQTTYSVNLNVLFVDPPVEVLVGQSLKLIQEVTKHYLTIQGHQINRLKLISEKNNCDPRACFWQIYPEQKYQTSLIPTKHCLTIFARLIKCYPLYIDQILDQELKMYNNVADLLTRSGIKANLNFLENLILFDSVNQGQSLKLLKQIATDSEKLGQNKYNLFISKIFNSALGLMKQIIEQQDLDNLDQVYFLQSITKIFTTFKVEKDPNNQMHLLDLLQLMIINVKSLTQLDQLNTIQVFPLINEVYNQYIYEKAFLKISKDSINAKLICEGINKEVLIYYQNKFQYSSFETTYELDKSSRYSQVKQQLFNQIVTTKENYYKEDSETKERVEYFQQYQESLELNYGESDEQQEQSSYDSSELHLKKYYRSNQPAVLAGYNATQDYFIYPIFNSTRENTNDLKICKSVLSQFDEKCNFKISFTEQGFNETTFIFQDIELLRVNLIIKDKIDENTLEEQGLKEQIQKIQGTVELIYDERNQEQKSQVDQQKLDEQTQVDQSSVDQKHEEQSQQTQEEQRQGQQTQILEEQQQPILIQDQHLQEEQKQVEQSQEKQIQQRHIQEEQKQEEQSQVEQIQQGHIQEEQKQEQQSQVEQIQEQQTQEQQHQEEQKQEEQKQEEQEQEEQNQEEQPQVEEQEDNDFDVYIAEGFPQSALSLYELDEQQFWKCNKKQRQQILIDGRAQYERKFKFLKYDSYLTNYEQYVTAQYISNLKVEQSTNETDLQKAQTYLQTDEFSKWFFQQSIAFRRLILSSSDPKFISLLPEHFQLLIKDQWIKQCKVEFRKNPSCKYDLKYFQEILEQKHNEILNLEKQQQEENIKDEKDPTNFEQCEDLETQSLNDKKILDIPNQEDQQADQIKIDDKDPEEKMLETVKITKDIEITKGLQQVLDDPKFFGTLYRIDIIVIEKILELENCQLGKFRASSFLKSIALNPQTSQQLVFNTYVRLKQSFHNLKKGLKLNYNQFSDFNISNYGDKFEITDQLFDLSHNQMQVNWLQATLKSLQTQMYILQALQNLNVSQDLILNQLNDQSFWLSFSNIGTFQIKSNDQTFNLNLNEILSQKYSGLFSSFLEVDKQNIPNLYLFDLLNQTMILLNHYVNVQTYKHSDFSEYQQINRIQKLKEQINQFILNILRSSQDEYKQLKLNENSMITLTSTFFQNFYTTCIKDDYEKRSIMEQLIRSNYKTIVQTAQPIFFINFQDLQLKFILIQNQLNEFYQSFTKDNYQKNLNDKQEFKDESQYNNWRDKYNELLYTFHRDAEVLNYAKKNIQFFKRQIRNIVKDQLLDNIEFYIKGKNSGESKIDQYMLDTIQLEINKLEQPLHNYFYDILFNSNDQIILNTLSTILETLALFDKIQSFKSNDVVRSYQYFNISIKTLVLFYELEVRVKGLKLQTDQNQLKQQIEDQDEFENLQQMEDSIVPSPHPKLSRLFTQDYTDDQPIELNISRQYSRSYTIKKFENQVPLKYIYESFVEKYTSYALFMLKLQQTQKIWARVLKANDVKMSLDLKISMIKLELQNECFTDNNGESSEDLLIPVNRNHVWSSTLATLTSKSIYTLIHKKFFIRYLNEEGYDAGGLSAEWITLLIREIMNPQLGLFQLSANHVTCQPNPHSYLVPDHLTHFRYIGRIIAAAIIKDLPIEVDLTRSVLKHITRQHLYIADLGDIDYELSKSLLQLLEIDVSSLDLMYNHYERIFGDLVCIDLGKGFDTPVTNENKKEYVKQVANYKMTLQIKEQIEAFVGGFEDVIPRRFLKGIEFKELGLKLSGLKHIDMDDFANNLILEGYQKSDQEIEWFLDIMKNDFTDQQKANLLFFITGSFKVHHGGFKEMKVTLTRHYNLDFLPIAHTCFKQLELPPYKSKAMMKEKLIMAMEEGTEGFYVS